MGVPWSPGERLGSAAPSSQLSQASRASAPEPAKEVLGTAKEVPGTAKEVLGTAKEVLGTTKNYLELLGIY